VNYLKNQINDSKYEDKGVLSYKNFKDEGDPLEEDEMNKSVLRKWKNKFKILLFEKENNYCC